MVFYPPTRITLLSGNEWFYQNYIEPVTKNAFYPYLYLGGEDWKNSILKKLDRLYSSFTTHPEQKSLYFTLMDEFLSIMKILYENLAVKNQGMTKASNELTALKSMTTCIDEHFTQRITLEDIALSGACCKSRCSLLFKKQAIIVKFFKNIMELLR